MSVPMIDPRLEGPPPTRHAERVAAEMTRWLIKEQIERLPAWTELFKSRRDGNPKAQEKFCRRLRDVGGPCAFHIALQSGKRGRYSMFIHRWVGIHPTTYSLLDEPHMKIPEKPALLVIFQRIISKGNYEDDIDMLPGGVITHHALARLAERCGAREPADLLAFTSDLSISIMKAIIDKQIASRFPPRGAWNLPFAGGVAVVVRDPDSGYIVVATVLGKGMKYEDERGVVRSVGVDTVLA